MKSFGLYFHVPFCVSKCPYCDFYSIKFDDTLAEAYTAAVCRALQSSRALYGGRISDTVYFGGGTPSLLGAQRLSRILGEAAKQFSFSDPEITLEANPGTVSTDLLKDLRYAGFNRISFGVQSGIDCELKALGRLHDAAEARSCVLNAQKAGFQNISADLMLGIPLQTRSSLRQSIGFLTELPLSHISAYMLKIEESTPFAAQNKSVLCADEDETAGMYLDCVEHLAHHGFTQYEISNFARGGAVSRHNLKYWLGEDYLGIGPSAHSLMDGKRFYAPRELIAFTTAENPFSLTVPDGDGGGFEEYVMLRLRLCEGLDTSKSEQLFGVHSGRLIEKARPFEKAGLLVVEEGVISLTPRGFLLSNSIIAELLAA